MAAYFDGSYLVTVEKGQSEDYGRTIRWNIDPLTWVGLGCNAAHRNLTPILKWNALCRDKPFSILAR